METPVEDDDDVDEESLANEVTLESNDDVDEESGKCGEALKLAEAVKCVLWVVVELWPETTDEDEVVCWLCIVDFVDDVDVDVDDNWDCVCNCMDDDEVLKLPYNFDLEFSRNLPS